MNGNILSYIKDTDFFISYSRQDIGASDYAVKLANELSKIGYTTYIDLYGSEPGKEIPHSLIKKLKQCKILIIIATEHCALSKSVQKEIEIFSESRKVILPFDFGFIDGAIWYNIIQGIAITKLESKQIFLRPTEEVINRIIGSYKYTKQVKRIKKTVLFALLTLGLTILGFLFLTLTIKFKNDKLNLVQNTLSESIKKSKIIDSQLISSRSDLYRNRIITDSIKNQIALQKQELNKLAINLNFTNNLFSNRNDLLKDVNNLLFSTFYIKRDEELMDAKKLLVSTQIHFLINKTDIRYSELREENTKLFFDYIKNIKEPYGKYVIIVKACYGLEIIEFENKSYIQISSFEEVGIRRIETLKSIIIKEIKSINSKLLDSIEFKSEIIFNGSREAFIYFQSK